MVAHTQVHYQQLLFTHDYKRRDKCRNTIRNMQFRNPLPQAVHITVIPLTFLTQSKSSNRRNLADHFSTQRCPIFHTDLSPASYHFMVCLPHKKQNIQICLQVYRFISAYVRNAEDALWYEPSKLVLSEKLKTVTAVILTFLLFLANTTSESTYYISTVTEYSEQDWKNNLLVSCVEGQVFLA